MDRPIVNLLLEGKEGVFVLWGDYNPFIDKMILAMPIQTYQKLKHSEKRSKKCEHWKAYWIVENKVVVK